MRRSGLEIVGMLGLVSVLAGALGCGSSNGGGGGGGGGSAAAGGRGGNESVGSAGSTGGQAAGGRGGSGTGGRGGDQAVGGRGGSGTGGSSGGSAAAGGRGGSGGSAGGSSGGQGGNGSSAAIASCNAYCDAYIAAACPTPNYTSANECKSFECGSISTTATAGCQTAVKTFYDCERTQADICGDTGCTDLFTALLSACS